METLPAWRKPVTNCLFSTSAKTELSLVCAILAIMFEMLAFWK
jgi:hypothetical protein